MEFIVSLLLQAQISITNIDLFLIEIGPIPCQAQWDFYNMCRVQDTKLRKRAWRRIKRSLPMSREIDLFIKKVEQASINTGFEIR